MPLALFGIEDGGLNLAVNLLMLFLVVVWLSLVYWTWADARRRIADPVLVGTAAIAALVPFIGAIVYTILRPPEYLADVREREIETQASELRMRHLTAQSCPRCEHPIERSWLRCPECRHRLKDPCPTCNRPVDPRWALCPYCETTLQGADQGRARGERPRSRSDQQPPTKPRGGSDEQGEPRPRARRGSAPSGQQKAPKQDRSKAAPKDRQKSSQTTSAAAQRVKRDRPSPTRSGGERRD